ncbi:MAG: cohesin domain-containing protein, partial [Candidatus Desantisbacteria bacterium]
LNNTIGYAEDLVINEIMYDPGTITCEWVELYNKGDVGISLKDWKFSDGNPHILTLYQGTMTIPAKGYTILVDNGDTFTTTYGTNTGNIIQTPMSLNNAGDTLAMIDISGGFVGSVTYVSSWGGTKNKTLERISPLGNDWGESTILGGTPGRKNSLTPAETSTPTATTWVRVYPDSGLSRFGGTYTIDIKIEDVVDLAGWQFSLYFNPAILQYLTAEEGNFLRSTGTQTFWVTPVIGTGSMKNVACSRIGANSLPVSGSGTLACVKFKVIGTQTTCSMINLGYLTLTNNYGGTISASVSNGSVSVAYGFDITNDNRVDITDLWIVGKIFGTQDGDREYNLGYDINMDGKIDLFDLVAISTNFSVNPDIVVQQSAGLYSLSSDKQGIVELYTASPVYKVGDEFELNLRVDDITNLYGIQFGVEFDPAVLSLMGTEKGVFLGWDAFQIESLKPTPGIKKLAQCKTGNVLGASGQGVVAKLRFKAMAEGNTEVKIKDVLALAPDMTHIPISSMNTAISIVSSKALSPDNIAYPNPSSNNQHIKFGQFDWIEIYTLAGELVKRIDSGKSWDLTNEDNKPVASGVYLYVLKTNDKILQGKIGVIK